METHDKLLELCFDQGGNLALGVWGSVLVTLPLAVAHTDLCRNPRRILRKLCEGPMVRLIRARKKWGNRALTPKRTDAFMPREAAGSNASSSPSRRSPRSPSGTPLPSLKKIGPAGVPLTGCFPWYSTWSIGSKEGGKDGGDGKDGKEDRTCWGTIWSGGGGSPEGSASQ